MEKKMIERINQEIEFCKRFYETATRETHNVNIARLNGMIEMLSLVTGKKYYFDENGLHEKN